MATRTMFVQTTSMSEFRVVTDDEGTTTIERMSATSQAFRPFVTVDAPIEARIGHPMAGTDVHGEPWTTSPVTAVIDQL